MPVVNRQNISGRIGQSAPVATFMPSPTFMKRIANKIDNGPLSNFCAFPTGTSFTGQDVDEQVVLIVRQHPVIFLPQMISVLVLILLAFILPGAIGNLGLTSGMTIATSIGAFIMLILAAMTLAFDTFIRWYFGVNIITNKRIIDVDYTNVMSHKFSETRLEHVEDVTHKVVGLLSMIFDYGTVYIQTAGSVNEFEFDNVASPNIVQDTLMDMLELDENLHGR